MFISKVIVQYDIVAIEELHILVTIKKDNTNLNDKISIYYIFYVKTTEKLKV